MFFSYCCTGRAEKRGFFIRWVSKNAKETTAK